jgi:hypothetical protein
VSFLRRIASIRRYDKRRTASLWCALYERLDDCNYPRCFNVQFGHAGGPLITRTTALALANQYLHKNGHRHRLTHLMGVMPGGRTLNGL